MNLRCPVCAGALIAEPSRYACGQGHAYDRARSGYVNLAPHARRRGDTRAMVEARERFLEAGHYDALAERVAEVSGPAEAAVELGCGTGHHLARVSAAAAVAFDLSKPAAAIAARRHPDWTVAVADVQDEIPLPDASADIVLSVFSPRPANEIARVTRPGGRFVAAFANPGHLAALRSALGLLDVEERKLARLEGALGAAFALDATERVSYEIELSEDEARLAVLMGPNAWHGAETRVAGPLRDRLDATVAAFVRR